jgi:hypothetical protein
MFLNEADISLFIFINFPPSFLLGALGIFVLFLFWTFNDSNRYL